MAPRGNAFGWEGVGVGLGAVDLAKHDPQLDKDSHEFEDVNVSHGLVDIGLCVVGFACPMGRLG